MVILCCALALSALERTEQEKTMEEDTSYDDTAASEQGNTYDEGNASYPSEE
jgi:hypothetical protein